MVINKINLRDIISTSYDEKSKFFSFTKQIKSNYAMLIFSSDNCPHCVSLKKTVEYIILDEEIKNLDIEFIEINIYEEFTNNNIQAKEIVEKLKIKKLPDWLLLVKDKDIYTIFSRFIGSKSYSGLLEEIKNLTHSENFLNH